MQIDCQVRVSHWYDIQVENANLKSMAHMKDKLDKAQLRVFAFDIETTK